MKKSKITKKIVAALLLIAMLVIPFAQSASAFTGFPVIPMSQPTQPAPGGTPGTPTPVFPYSDGYANMLVNFTTDKMFSSSLLLKIYTEETVAGNEELSDYLRQPGRSLQNLETEGIIKSTGEANTAERSAGKITVEDAQAILYLAYFSYDVESQDDSDRTAFEGAERMIAKPIADELGIDVSDVKMTANVRFPKELVEFLADERGIELDDYSVFGDGVDSFVIDENTTTEFLEEKYAKVREMEETVVGRPITGSAFTMVSAQAVATTDTQRITYDLMLGKDFNWYLVPNNIEDLGFRTNLTYVGKTKDGEKVAGQMKDDTFFPQYYDNYVSEEDTDATATIKSKTDEEIVAIKIGDKVIDMKTDGTPNEEGWYYPDTEDKKIIAKDYIMEDYDNIIDDGKVKETVGIVGALGGESEEVPSIEWTFRYIKEEKTTNPDNSTTIVETTNLPIDPDGIPEGWEPIYDPDGKTIHKITITIPVNKGYDKDVPVKQLRDDGKDVYATTHVTIEPKKLSKTGESFILTAIAIGFAVFMITRFKRFKNTNK